MAKGAARQGWGRAARWDDVAILQGVELVGTWVPRYPLQTHTTHTHKTNTHTLPEGLHATVHKGIWINMGGVRSIIQTSFKFFFMCFWRQPGSLANLARVILNAAKKSSSVR